MRISRLLIGYVHCLWPKYHLATKGFCLAQEDNLTNGVVLLAPAARPAVSNGGLGLGEHHEGGLISPRDVSSAPGEPTDLQTLTRSS